MDRSNAESMEEVRRTGKELTIVLHGIFESYYRNMAPLVFFLKRQGLCVVSVGYNYNTNLKGQAEEIAWAIDRIMRETQVTKINLVGRSLGGAVARYYTEAMRNQEKLHKIVTIFTPISVKQSVGTIAYRMEMILGGKENKSFQESEEIEGLFTVKNYLALYGFDDRIVGNQYPTVLPIRQQGVPGGHVLSAYNPYIMEAVCAYLKEPTD